MFQIENNPNVSEEIAKSNSGLKPENQMSLQRIEEIDPFSVFDDVDDGIFDEFNSAMDER